LGFFCRWIHDRHSPILSGFSEVRWVVEVFIAHMFRVTSRSLQIDALRPKISLKMRLLREPVSR